MFATHVAGAILSHVSVAATWMVQEGGGAMATDPLGLWKAMGWVARPVVSILFIMSGWSIVGSLTPSASMRLRIVSIAWVTALSLS